MHIDTVCFFGHRQIDNSIQVEERLEREVMRLIREREYIDFLIGRDGAFDLMAASVVRRASKAAGLGNTHMTLVLPYMTAEYRDNTDAFHKYYDAVEICAASASSHFKAAFQIRNREMVDRSDLVICCIQHRKGGAYQAVRYAEKCKIDTINVGLI